MGISSGVRWQEATRVREHMTPDAVVVVPGVMGSELRDTRTGAVIWGLRELRWYLRAWCSGRGLGELAVTDAERAGDTSRVEASGLLRFPAFAPVLAGFEPYTRLVEGICRVVLDRSAVLEFAYDWRLPVTHNAALLAEHAVTHLARWRDRSGRRDARLVLVGHSMGGLLCRELSAIPGAVDDVRAVVTLGCPFDGAAKAAVLLGTGAGAPLPRGRLREVAMTMPGIYELLPSYRCVDSGESVRVLSPQDVGDVGGDVELATVTSERRAALVTTWLPGHRALIGVEQPTVSSLSLTDGVITGHPYTFTMNRDGELERQRVAGIGDGTVPRTSALPGPGVTPMPLAQQHGALAKSPEAITFVCDVLVHGEADTGPRLGETDIGLDLPDVVSPAVEWTATLTGVAPHEASCTVADADTGQPVDHPRPHRRDGAVVIAAVLPEPGVYRVEVTGGGTSAVSQLVMAADPEMPS